MFDIGWSELLVIGVVSLIVVGPKDLPGMFHTLGRFTAKARSMAREFSRAMEDAAKESGLNEVSKDLKSMTSAKSLGLDKMQQAVGKFEAWDPMKKTPTKAAEKPAAKPSEKAAPGSETARLAADKADMKEKLDAIAAGKLAIAAEEARAKAEAKPAGGAKPATEAKPAKAAAKPRKTTAKAASTEAPSKAEAKAPARKAPARAPAKTAAKAPAKAEAKPAAKPAKPRRKATDPEAGA